MYGKVVTILLVIFCCAMIMQTSDAIDPRCLLPLEHGPCRALMPRYGYNPATKECEMFAYGGCRGNENNFNNLQECQQACSS